MNERHSIPAGVKRQQDDASAPHAHVWVTANAGSGKTHVLTLRVLRLLLTGVTPDALLCLTFTRAAAAEMRERVAGRLGRWATLADEELHEELHALTGLRPDAQKLMQARRLFAEALETPGGLKIHTIHAFAESVLHRFPVEAGVPVGFRVIEDTEQARLLSEARDDVLLEGLMQDGPLSGPVKTLMAAREDGSLDQDLNAAATSGPDLHAVLADLGAAEARLQRALGLTQVQSLADIELGIVDRSLLTPTAREEICAFADKPGGRQVQGKLRDYIHKAKLSADDLRAVLFTKDGGPSQIKKDLQTSRPDLATLIEQEQARVAALLEQMLATSVLERSKALMTATKAIQQRYERAKQQRQLLDYDDLISHMQALLKNEAFGPWVRYKLDGAITHILVDESQDTNPAQWEIVRLIAEEFFNGESAAERSRSFFAVGDPKQSIYSFQGAKPEMFHEERRRYTRMADQVGQGLVRVNPATSFRTLDCILNAVDLVFDREAFRLPLLADPYEPHNSARRAKGGTVTLWPVVEPLDPDALDALTDSSAQGSTESRLAENIAREIDGWIEQGRLLTGHESRLVAADDVLILVQTRGALFHEIIRALKKRNIPTPGSDRLAVGNHIAVLDLLALADVLLNPADDLQLAIVLRSPLFNVDEDDLYEIAHDRSGSLWAALGETENAHGQAAYEALAGWRTRLDFSRPYDFYADILYAGGGLKAFHQRLGTEVDDVLTEFLDKALDHENSGQPSLQGFVADMRSTQSEIKRELAERGNGVRVMTVHGSKGLEAPIVILADATRKQTGSNRKDAVHLGEAGGGMVLVHATNKEERGLAGLEFTSDAEINEANEYWRKLYVAMTRAEDELYVTGYLDNRKTVREKKLADSWYEAVHTALAEHSRDQHFDQWEDDGLIFPIDAEASRFGDKASGSGAASASMMTSPEPLPPRTRVQILRPSLDGHDAPPPSQHVTFSVSADRVGDAETARQAGIAVHALLQHLDKVDEVSREQAGLAALRVLLPGQVERHAEMVQTVRGILSDPAHAAIFSDRSRAEVPIAAEASIDGKPVRIMGRIDRLLVEDSRVLIIDFKSDALVTSEPPPHYVRQLALYALALKKIFPDKPIQGAILWTVTGQLQSIAAEALNQHLDAITV